MIYKKRLCAYCGKEIVAKRKLKYCNAECRKNATYEREKKERDKKRKENIAKGINAKACKYCGKIFYPGKKNKLYCSKICRYECVEEEKKNPKPKKNLRLQLCEFCQKACGGCNWSNELKPVKGWDALKVPRKQENGGYSVGYKIIGCPEFVPDEDYRKE